MRMSFGEFEDLTPRQFDNAVQGFYKHLEILDNSEWVKIRQLAFYIAMPNVKKGSLKKPSDLFKIGDEQVTKKNKPMTTEQALELAKKWA